MPRKLPTACAHPGCPELTREPYCPEHTALRKEQQRKLEKDNPTPPTAEHLQAREFYKSKRWRTFRARIMSSRPPCRCGAPATLLDHIQPLRAGGAPFDVRNLQPLCDRCHNRKRQVESSRAKGIQADYPEDLVPRRLRDSLNRK